MTTVQLALSHHWRVPAHVVRRPHIGRRADRRHAARSQRPGTAGRRVRPRPHGLARQAEVRGVRRAPDGVVHGLRVRHARPRRVGRRLGLRRRRDPRRRRGGRARAPRRACDGRHGRARRRAASRCCATPGSWAGSTRWWGSRRSRTGTGETARSTSARRQLDARIGSRAGRAALRAWGVRLPEDLGRARVTRGRDRQDRSDARRDHPRERRSSVRTRSRAPLVRGGGRAEAAAARRWVRPRRGRPDPGVRTTGWRA